MSFIIAFTLRLSPFFTDTYVGLRFADTYEASCISLFHDTYVLRNTRTAVRFPIKPKQSNSPPLTYSLDFIRYIRYIYLLTLTLRLSPFFTDTYVRPTLTFSYVRSENSCSVLLFLDLLL